MLCVVLLQMLAVLLTEVLSSPEPMRAGIFSAWIPSDGELAIRCRSSISQQPYAGESISRCLGPQQGDKDLCPFLSYGDYMISDFDLPRAALVGGSLELECWVRPPQGNSSKMHLSPMCDPS